MKGTSTSLYVSFLALLFMVDPALAQQGRTASNGNASATHGKLEEVVVTAQRRRQSLMSVPMSIQALSGKQLNQIGINDLTSLQFTTPGYFPDTNNGFVQVFMRGIGNSIFVGADPSVATFIDGVPQIYGVMVDKLPDVQRVEILKGAQGGLYGRNSTGGVINIITRHPTMDALKGNLLVSYGQKNTFRGAGYLNVPMGDKVALNMALERDLHDAYIKNLAPKVPYSAANFPNGWFFTGSPQQTADFFNAAQNPSKQDKRNFWAGRSKLLIEPTDNFSFTLAGSYANKDDTASGQFVSTTPQFNQAALESLFSQAGVTTNLPPGFILGSGGKKWSNSLGPQSYSHIKDYTVSGTAVWSGPGFDLTSITAYRHQKSETVGDSGSSMVPFVPFHIDYKRHYVYQEFRFVSTFDGPWHFLGGVTYLNNELKNHTNIYFLSFEFPYAATTVDQTIKNWSVYAQGGYDFTDRLNLTVSGRYIHEKNKADFTVPVLAGAHSLEDKFIPSATLKYQLDDGNVYIRWARGFKTGGINTSTAPVYYPKPTDGSIFGPETVDTYEAGFKSSLFDRTVQVTGAVFYNNYRDLQVNVRPLPAYAGTVTTAVVNAKSARTYGAEGSVAWRVIDPLTISANVGYLHAEYHNFALSGSAVLSSFDLGGKRMTHSPKWQLSFNADLDQPISDGLHLVGSVLAAYTSKVIFIYSGIPGVLPNATDSGYWLLNGRIGVKTSDDKYGFYIVANNLLDKEYYIGADSGPFGNLKNYGKRRIVSAEFTVRF